jgi:transposase-like protein
MKRLTYLNIADQIPTEPAAYEFLERLRWANGVVCPHCGVIGDHRFLEFANGSTRRTNRGSQTYRRLWKCRDCHKQFSVLTNTVMHGSHIPARTWVLVFFEMVSNKNGLAAREVERKYGLSPKSAWFLLHRIREAMVREPAASLFSGVVVADETWIGGDPKNRHANERPGKQGQTDKTPVLSLIDATTGEVRSRVVADVSGKTLRKVIRENVDMAQNTLHTDSWSPYDRIGKDMAGHESVNHHAGEYVRNGVSTNKAENYFSQLKRSVDGTHHHVSVEHLPRYLAEFDFRYTSRKVSDTERLGMLMPKVAGKRVTYRPLKTRADTTDK